MCVCGGGGGGGVACVCVGARASMCVRGMRCACVSVHYLGGDLDAVFLQVHDGVADLDVNGVHHRLDVERALQPLRQVLQGVCNNARKQTTCQYCCNNARKQTTCQYCCNRSGEVALAFDSGVGWGGWWRCAVKPWAWDNTKRQTKGVNQRSRELISALRTSYAQSKDPNRRR